MITNLFIALLALPCAAQTPQTQSKPSRAQSWAALQREPQNALRNVLYGEALADEGDYLDAIPYLQKASALDTRGSWIKAWALNYLGRCYFAIGDSAKSKQALLESANLGATDNVTKNSNRYLHTFGLDDLFKTWEVAETDHFVFHFQTPSANPDHAGFMKEREDALAAICSFFDDIRLPFKIHYFVWNSKPEARQSVGFELGFAVPQHGVVQTSFDNETPGHETTHIVASYFAGAPKTAMFINEGIAVHLNQKHWDNLATAKRRWKAGSSIKAFWTSKDLDSENYPLAGAFVAYLLEWGGKEKLLALLRQQSYGDALRIYGAALEPAISDFEAELASPALITR